MIPKRKEEKKHKKKGYTCSSSFVLWRSASVGPAVEIGFVMPYCLRGGGGVLPMASELPIGRPNESPTETLSTK